MNRTSRLATVALSAVVGLCSALTVAAPAGAANDFYTPPQDLPARNGSVVKAEPTKLAISFSQLGQQTRLPGDARRIMYKSTNEAGQAVGVTGTYIEPAKKWSGTGPRPLVSYSVGTMGVSDACAPSKTFASLINVENGRFMIGYDIPFIYGLLNEGIAVVITDYIGFGTPGVHTYMNRSDQASAVLDAARAALELPDTSIESTSPVGLYGYSQGGGASGAAVEMAPTYAPELNLKGAYVGAPPADLFEVLKGIEGTLLTGAIPWAINALTEYRPDMKAAVDEVLNDRGRSYLEEARTQCLPDAVLGAGFKRSSAWTKSGKLAAEEIRSRPVIADALAEQKLGKRKPHVPVLVVTGTKDDGVAHGQARQVALDWCGLGADVTYTPAHQLISSGGFLLNHIGPAITHSHQARSWMVERLKGVPATDNCAAAHTLP